MRRLLLMIALLCGCQKAAVPKTRSAIPLDQVPPVVLKAAQAKLPNVKFNSANKMANGDYEVRGTTATGKIQEAEVSEAGEVLVVE